MVSVLLLYVKGRASRTLISSVYQSGFAAEIHDVNLNMWFRIFNVFLSDFTLNNRNISNSIVTGIDSTSSSSSLPDNSYMCLFVFVSVCLCAPQGWVCLFQQGPFLRAECMRCMWRFRGRTTWGTRCRLPHQCPKAVFTPVNSTMSRIHRECCHISTK